MPLSLFVSAAWSSQRGNEINLLIAFQLGFDGCLWLRVFVDSHTYQELEALSKGNALSDSS